MNRNIHSLSVKLGNHLYYRNLDFCLVHAKEIPTYFSHLKQIDIDIEDHVNYLIKGI